MVVTGGWDKKVRYWDLRSSTAQTGELDLGKVYAMDAVDNTMVVGTSDREVHIVDLDMPTTIFRSLKSPLRQQTTCISVYSDKDGFAIGSIEGRCAIRFVSEAQDGRSSFAFKCHRLRASCVCCACPGCLTHALSWASGSTEVYPVNAIAWHPTYVHSFSTVGGDGTMAFWDKARKQRLKNMSASAIGIEESLVCCEWDREGVLYAYASGYDWRCVRLASACCVFRAVRITVFPQGRKEGPLRHPSKIWVRRSQRAELVRDG